MLNSNLEKMRFLITYFCSLSQKISIDGGHFFCDDAQILFILGVIRRNFKRIWPYSLTVDVFGQLVLTEQMLAQRESLD